MAIGTVGWGHAGVVKVLQTVTPNSCEHQHAAKGHGSLEWAEHTHLHESTVRKMVLAQ